MKYLLKPKKGFKTISVRTNEAKMTYMLYFIFKYKEEGISNLSIATRTLQVFVLCGSK